jgi:hypothetical protein
MPIRNSLQDFDASTPPQDGGIGATIRWGIQLGGAIGLLLAVLVGVWNKFWGGAPIQRYGISVTTLAFVYVGGGIVAGAVVGALLRFVKSDIHAIGLGIIGAIPVYFGAALALEGPPWQWSMGDWIGIAVLSIIGGGYFGFKCWDEGWGNIVGRR